MKPNVSNLVGRLMLSRRHILAALGLKHERACHVVGAMDSEAAALETTAIETTG